MSKKLNMLFLVFAIIWMMVIFGFSSRPASLSSQDSYRVARLYSELFVKGFNTWEPTRQETYIKSIIKPVRKIAHACEYAVLALLLFVTYISSFFCCSIKPLHRRLARAALLSFLTSAAFACTDEFHQLFVDGRGGQIIDVMIDTGGAALGTCFITAAVFLASKVYARHKKV